MIESLLRAYIKATAFAAFPSWAEPDVAVFFPSGEIEYGRKKGRDIIGSERLTAQVTVHAPEPIDRREFIRAFPRREIKLSEGYTVWQEYQRHETHDYQDKDELLAVSFYINYIYDIKEAQ